MQNLNLITFAPPQEEANRLTFYKSASATELAGSRSDKAVFAIKRLIDQANLNQSMLELLVIEPGNQDIKKL